LEENKDNNNILEFKKESFNNPHKDIEWFYDAFDREQYQENIIK